MYKIKCGGIYIIEVGDYYYIGMSVSVFDRIGSHYTSLKKGIHSSKKLQKKFNELGIQNFNFRVLEYISISDFKIKSGFKGKELENGFRKLLLKKEKEWMKRYSVTYSLNSDNKHFS